MSINQYISSCNQPYIYFKCNKAYLNLQAPPCLVLDSNYKACYIKLYDNTLKYSLNTEFSNMILANSAQAYDKFLNLILSIFAISLTSPSPRIVITESDGTVVIDTAKTDKENTFTNWKLKTINENHNTRVAIMTSQMFSSGVGYETKYSTTVNSNQVYVAIRLGIYLNNPGSIRLSINI